MKQTHRQLLWSTIIVLTIAAAAIHLSRAAINPHITVLFTLNAIGYLVLLGMLLWLPLSQRRRIGRVFIGYTALTLALFFIWGIMKGEWPLIGFVDKAIEVVLIALVLQAVRRDTNRQRAI